MNLQPLTEQFKAAQQAGVAGMESAYQHTLLETPDFDHEAKKFFRDYCVSHETVFTEDVSNQYAAFRLPEPANPKAWGAITRHAQKQGWITKDPVGLRQRVLGHGTRTAVWGSLICKARA